MANFEKALELVLKNEGGYVNDPNDNGGETYKGISRRANPQWSGWKIIDGYKKKYKDFKKKLDSDNELQKCVKSLYRSNYWNPIKGDDLVHQDMAEEMFDAAVNFGITKAIKLAQKTVGFEQSGVMTNILVERLNQEK